MGIGPENDPTVLEIMERYLEPARLRPVNTNHQDHQI
jgi:hypothetical protein